MRLETGVTQDGDDWPGIFIRGDDALMGYAPALAAVLAGRGTAFDTAKCRGLLNLLRQCKEPPQGRVQRVTLNEKRPPPETGAG